ncbi:hypothetical protein DTO282F9_8994 [Paecilomyces variotii]|nr:hypothetical protein DTO282F9_8994 [Paecilomyces variotii]
MSLEDSTPAEYVTLVSSDGFEFVLPRSTACVSGTIRRMLDPASKFSEAITGRCVLENISGVVLEKVCEALFGVTDGGGLFGYLRRKFRWAIATNHDSICIHGIWSGHDGWEKAFSVMIIISLYQLPLWWPSHDEGHR